MSTEITDTPSETTNTPVVAAPAAAAADNANRRPYNNNNRGQRGGRDGNNRGPRGQRPNRDGNAPADEERDAIKEKVVFINRCAKVVKGGRRFSFSALIVCGDQAGKVGYGFGKANEVAEAIRKASEASRKNMVPIVLNNTTIPHQVTGEFGGGQVLLMPASPGTGIIAGGGVRAVLEAAGVKDVLAKSQRSNNPSNVVKATLAALQQLRSQSEIHRVRGIKIKPRATAPAAEEVTAQVEA